MAKIQYQRFINNNNSLFNNIRDWKIGALKFWLEGTIIQGNASAGGKFPSIHFTLQNQNKFLLI